MIWESDVMGSRNWMSREVTMPTSLPPSNPVSAKHLVDIPEVENVESQKILKYKDSPDHAEKKR
jgi:hypothetical protein